MVEGDMADHYREDAYPLQYVDPWLACVHVVLRIR
jgi:hypothetical protein